MNIKSLQDKLKDERGKKVIFVSHCILNENTRYLGGAFQKAGVNEIIDELQKQEIGVAQMKCPEQKAWGGVLKKQMLRGYGIKGTFLDNFRKLYLKYFIWQTKKVYRKIAREVVYEIQDYIQSGYQVVGIIGVDGSPSCGVLSALDINKSSDFVADLSGEKITKDFFNIECYKSCLITGAGLYTQALQDQLTKRDIKIKFYSIDLLKEMKGEKINLDFKI